MASRPRGTTKANKGYLPSFAPRVPYRFKLCRISNVQLVFYFNGGAGPLLLAFFVRFSLQKTVHGVSYREILKFPKAFESCKEKST